MNHKINVSKHQLKNLLLDRWSVMGPPAEQGFFPAKIKIAGETVHIGDFPTYIEASLARASAGTLWNLLKPHVTIKSSWKQETTP